jgi:thioredoxin reductase (NADPH)
MRKQAERFGVRFMMDEVSASDLSGMVKKVSLMLGGELLARTVILATGASARYLGLPSEQQLMGKGVSACATCDGSFFKGLRVAVIGGGDTAMEDALYLSRLASQVTVVHRRDAFRASKIMADRVLSAPNIDVVWNAVVEEVLDPAKGEVTGLRLKDVKTGERMERAVQGVFIAIGHTPEHGGFCRPDRTGFRGVYRGGRNAHVGVWRVCSGRRARPALQAGCHCGRYRVHGGAGSGAVFNCERIICGVF